MLAYLCFSIIWAFSTNISTDNQYSIVNKKTYVHPYWQQEGINENTKMLLLEKFVNSYQFEIL
jgi:hypothetical protein